MIDRFLEERQRLGEPARQGQGVPEIGREGRPVDLGPAATAEGEATLEQRHRVVEIALTEMDAAETPQGGEDAQRLTDRLGKGQRLAPDRDPLREGAHLAETPREIGP